jgi:hypothetical protein
MRIEVRGAINKSWEGTDAQSVKFIKQLREIQLKKVYEAAGEEKVKKYFSELSRYRKVGGRPPLEPKNLNSFPLTIKIN